MIKTKQIKGLQSQINKKKDTIKALQQECSAVKKQISEESQKLNTLKQKLTSLKRSNKAILITDHALVRFFERVKGYDIEEIKKEILTESVQELIKKLGTSGEYPTGNDFSIVLRDGNVVTIKN